MPDSNDDYRGPGHRKTHVHEPADFHEDKKVLALRMTNARVEENVPPPIPKTKNSHGYKAVFFKPKQKVRLKAVLIFVAVSAFGMKLLFERGEQRKT